MKNMVLITIKFKLQNLFFTAQPEMSAEKWREIKQNVITRIERMFSNSRGDPQVVMTARKMAEEQWHTDNDQVARQARTFLRKLVKEEAEMRNGDTGWRRWTNQSLLRNAYYKG